MADIFLKPKEEKWAQKLLIPRRKRGPSTSINSPNSKTLRFSSQDGFYMPKKKKQMRSPYKKMSKTWSEKLKKSKIPRTSTGRLPMPKELLEEEESEESQARKAKEAAEKKRLAEENWKSWKEKKDEFEKQKAIKLQLEKEETERKRQEKERKKLEAKNAYMKWNREKIKENRNIVKGLEERAKQLRSIEEEKNKLLSERALLLKRKKLVRAGVDINHLNNETLDSGTSVMSVRSTMATNNSSSVIRKHKRRMVTKKLKKLMKTPYTQQMTKNDEAHYKVWGKKKNKNYQKVPAWLIPKNIALNMGWEEGYGEGDTEPDLNDEYMAAYYEEKMVQLESIARYVFSKCDKNNRQYITKIDIMNVMHMEDIIETINHCPPLQPLLHPKLYKETFDKIDSNSDGKIDYFELLNFCGIPTSPQTVNSPEGSEALDNNENRSAAAMTNVIVTEKADDEEGQNILNEIKNNSKNHTNVTQHGIMLVGTNSENNNDNNNHHPLGNSNSIISNKSSMAKKRNKKKKRRKRKKNHLIKRPPWNGNEYEMKPRQDLSNTDDMGPYVAPPRHVPVRTVKRTGGGFADPSTLDAQRARVAISAAVNSGVVDSPKKLQEDETFQELGKIIDTNIKKLLNECKKRDGEKRGIITRVDFANALMAVGFNGAENDRDQLLNELDHTNSGYIKYKELQMIQNERKRRERSKHAVERKRLSDSREKAKRDEKIKKAKAPKAPKAFKAPVSSLARELENTLKKPLPPPPSQQHHEDEKKRKAAEKKAAATKKKEQQAEKKEKKKKKEEKKMQPWLLRARQRQKAEQDRRARAMIVDGQKNADGFDPVIVKSATFDQIDYKAIANLCSKTVGKPPALVMRILGSMCMLLGENPTWLVAQRTISEDGFIERLRNLDASSVSEETLHRLQRVTHHPRFTPETLVEDEKYFPFAPLCDWVLEAVTSADEHFREKWAAIGLEAPTDDFGEGNAEVDDVTNEALREQREAQMAAAKAEKDAALALKERLEAERAKKLASEKARIAGIAKREAEVALREAEEEEDEARRAREDMDQRGDTSEYARAILEKEEREAKAARARAEDALQAAHKAAEEAEKALELYKKEEEEALAMEKLADEETRIAELEAEEAEIAKRRAQIKIKEAKEQEADKARYKKLEAERIERERIAKEKATAEKKRLEEERAKELEAEAQRVLAEQKREADALKEQLKRQEEEHKFEAEIAHEQSDAMAIIEHQLDAKDKQKKLAARAPPPKPKREMTRREMLLEKRRQKALEREAEARANSPKSNEEDDIGQLDADSLKELESLTNTIDGGVIDDMEEKNDVAAEKEADDDVAKQTDAAVKIQKLQRGKAHREKVKKQKTAAVKIQAAARGRVERGFAIKRANQRKKHFSSVYNGTREMEGALLYLFSKIDRHDHGHITKKDIMKAMRDKEIVGLLESCPPLQPLLRPRSYAATFHAMDTNHDGSIEYEELRMFCAGMYSIDASNDIAVKMDLALNSITKGYNPTHGDNDALNQAEASQENLNEVLHKIFAALHTPSHDEEESEEQSLTNIAEEAVKVTKVELLRGLHKPEVRETIRQCPPLVPLLKPRAFWATLMAIDTDHDGTISYEEVRGFCAGVLTAQNALVHEVKDAVQINYGIKETLKTLYSVANFSIEKKITFLKLCDALDDTYTLADIAGKSPILELQEDDGNSFTSLKHCLLESRFAQDRIDRTNDLYENGARQRTGSTADNEELNEDAILISFNEVEFYSCGLCAAKESVKNGLTRKKFPEDSQEYTLLKALNVLFTMLRVSKQEDDPTCFQAASKLSIVNAMTDHVIIEKLQLCRDIRVMLQPLWYWPVLSALNTAEENKVTLEELRPFICGLNTIYLQHSESNQEHHVQHSREYLDQIDGAEKSDKNLARFIWPQASDKYIGKSISKVELEFYEHVAVTNAAMRRSIPRFGGVCYHHGAQYLKLENILAGFSSPCVVDIKIGKDKNKEQLDKNGTAYKIAGMRLWDPDFHQFQDVDTDHLTLERFFKLGTSQTIVRIDLLRELIKLLSEKLTLFQSKTNNVDFFGSSILIAYDAEEEKVKPRFMFVDFENYDILRTATRIKNHEDMCIVGLTSIIDELKGCLQNLVGSLLEGMLAIYESMKKKNIDSKNPNENKKTSNNKEEANADKRLSLIKSIETDERLRRSIWMMSFLLDKTGDGYIYIKDLVKAQNDALFQNVIRLCPRSIHDFCFPEKIHQLFDKIEKEFEDRLSVQELYKYVKRQENLNEDVVEDEEGDDNVENALPSLSMAKEWANALKEHLNKEESIWNIL